MDDIREHLRHRGLLPALVADTNPQAAARAVAPDQPTVYAAAPAPGPTTDRDHGPAGFSPWCLPLMLSTFPPVGPVQPSEFDLAWDGCPDTQHRTEAIQVAHPWRSDLLPAAPMPASAPAPWPSRFEQEQAQRARQARSEAWGRQAASRAYAAARVDVRRRHTETDPSPPLRLACGLVSMLATDAAIRLLRRATGGEIDEETLGKILHGGALGAAGLVGAEELAHAFHEMMPPKEKPLDLVPFFLPDDVRWEAQRLALDVEMVELGWQCQRAQIEQAAGAERGADPRCDVRMGPLSLRLRG